MSCGDIAGQRSEQRQGDSEGAAASGSSRGTGRGGCCSGGPTEGAARRGREPNWRSSGGQISASGQGTRELQAEAGRRDGGEQRQQRKQRERRALWMEASRSWVVGLRPATGEWGSGAVTSYRGMGDAEVDRKLLVVTATVGAANGGASTWVVLAQGMAGRVAVTGGAAGRSFAAEVERRRSRNRGNLGAKNSWRR